MIVSSEFDKTDDEIIDIYRGLWRIEETFKLTKSELDSRPVYMSNKEHIEAHFLTCYIALVLSRILQHKLDKKYSVGKILESLGRCMCSHIENNYYLFSYYDKVLEDIGNVLNIDFSKKYMRLQEIKKILVMLKNEVFHKNFPIKNQALKLLLLTASRHFFISFWCQTQVIR